MEPDKISSTDTEKSSMHQLYRFLGGAVLGAFMVLVPYWLAPIDVTPLSIGVGSALVITCGLLSVRFGKQFFETLANLLGASGLY
ncbi:MAG: hypothetical protein AAGA75_14900 [Cyanobacteria bacterium P01_E01_bin.6]